MSHFPSGAMECNRGLTAGCIVTEIRLHPFIADNADGWRWEHAMRTVHFKIIEVLRHEYKCRYMNAEGNEEFYWPYWDKQPNHGFWIDNSSPVKYYTKLA